MMKIMIYGLVSALVLLLSGGTAPAHKVNIFAYIEGGKVYTESYFSGGKPVKNGKVLVYDSRDKLLFSGITDKEGLFSFDIPKIEDLTIVLEATMGHKSSFTLKKAVVEAGK